MSIRILVGTEHGSSFKHACFFNSSTDIVFGPLFYESGKPNYLDPGDIAEAFGKWIGWDALLDMTTDEMKEKQHDLDGLLERDPALARAEGEAAGRQAVAEARGTGQMERMEDAEDRGAKREFEDEYDNIHTDEWGRLSTDGQHPWAIVLKQEEAWTAGFHEGFLAAFHEYLAEAKATIKSLGGK